MDNFIAHAHLVSFRALLRSWHHVLCDGGVVCCWAAPDFTDRQTEEELLTAACWAAGLSGSVKESARHTGMSRERESIRGSDFFLSLPISSPWSDPLWPGTSVLLASLSFFIFAPPSLPPLSFSFAHNFPSIPLIWHASQSHSSTTSVSVCVCVCCSARACVCI